MRNCVICKYGEIEPGTTTVMLECDEMMIFKNVPAEVCQTCGEAYLDAATARHLEHIVEEVARGGVQVDVRSYVAA
jgi:YgiT-type zinc finger domain-containing protein